MSAELIPLYRDHIADLAHRTGLALIEEGFDAVAIHSGLPAKRSAFDDQYWPLRPVPHFQHWAHLAWPDSVLHLASGKKPRLLFARDKSFWERLAEPDWAFLGSSLDLVELDSAADLAQNLSPRGRTAFIGDSLKRGVELGIMKDNVNPPALLAKLDELRVFKTPYEVACLREASRIASAGHKAVRDAFRSGLRSELDLHLLFLSTTRQDDPETPYKNIVALGPTASILHNIYYRRAPVEAKSLLLDAGATYKGYACDITRTYLAPDSSEAGALFGELLAGMDAMQQALCGSVSVGRPYESLHDEAHQRLSELLTGTGIVKLSAGECTTSGLSRKFLPHGLGHSLGLQTHDVGCAKIPPRGDNSFLRNTRIIEPNQVFTIEPGLYFIDALMGEIEGGTHRAAIDWQKIAALKPFGGIRIEDDVVVTPQTSPGGVENLTREVL